MTQGQLGLADHEFWLDPLRTRRAVERPLVRSGQEHVVLDAPTTVALDQGRRTLPVVVLRVAPNTPGNALDFGRHAVLVATVIEQSRTSAEVLVLPDPDERRLSLDGIDLPPPQGTLAEAYVVDLREHLDLPWTEPATIVIRLVLRDRVLAEARVALTVSDAGYVDPEVTRYLEERSRQPDPMAIWPKPGVVLPSYERRDGSPALPATLGITLVTPRVVPVSDAARALLHGSFRLPIRPRDRCPPAPFATVSRPATAVVPITVVLVGSRHAAPVVWRLAVPSLEPVLDEDGTLVARGFFALDTGELTNLAGVPQTYFLHAFSGELRASPATMALVAIPGNS